MINKEQKLRTLISEEVKKIIKEYSEKVEGTITFKTYSQYALWEYELIGQLSDGMWENTKPYDHWEFWSDLKSMVGNNTGVKVKDTYIHPAYNGYNFSRLIEYVGDRMLCIGRMGKITNNKRALQNAEYLAEFPTYNDYLKLMKYKNKYPKENIVKIPASIIKKYYETEYTEKDLLNDLREIKRVMKTYPSDRQYMKQSQEI